MNYLAHLYLSGNDDDLMIGNFIGDHVKGRDFSAYSTGVSNGIILHRFIDSFTDSHNKFHESKLRLRPVFKKYSPVIVDMYYDHFLAANWKEYSHIDLLTFSEYCYSVIDKNKEHLPESSLHMFSYMRKQNWLTTYETIEGLDRALTGMSRRTTFSSGMENAANFLKDNYREFELEFASFFKELEDAVEKKIAELSPHQA